MCWHCNDWWPLSPLGKAILGLPTNEPYWIHGVWHSNLPEICAFTLSGEKEPSTGEYVGVKKCIAERTPNYREIIDAMLPKEGRPVKFLDLCDFCECELPNTDTMR